MDISEIPETKIIKVDEWSTMSLIELYEQKQILANRLEFAYNIKNMPMLNSLQHGITSIEYYITNQLNSPDLKQKNVIT